jgi:hypothetical protein
MFNVFGVLLGSPQPQPSVSIPGKLSVAAIANPGSAPHMPAVRSTVGVNFRDSEEIAGSTIVS